MPSLESCPTPFIEVALAADLRISSWNQRAEQTFDIPADAALGRAIGAVVPVVGGEATWRRALAADGEAIRVWTLADPPRAFEWVVQVEETGVRLWGRDVSERVREQQQRDVAAQLVAAICQHMDVALWAIDRDGVFLFQDGRASLIPPRSMLGGNLFAAFGDNPAMQQVRAALAGETLHTDLVEEGRSWETWFLPAPAAGAGNAAVIGLSLDVSEQRRAEQVLRDKLELIERQQQVIRSLSTPIIEVWDGVLTLPLVGLVDSVRTAEILDSLLAAVARARARYAILDMTGVEVVDTSTAANLLGLIRAIRLLGAEGIVTGIHPNIARTMVALGVDLSQILVHADLREALKFCIRRGST